MSQLFAEKQVLWTALIALGYPLSAILAVEIRRQTANRFRGFSSFINLLQISFLPVGALYLLLSRVAQYDANSTPVKFALTVLAIVTINALLYALNQVMRADSVMGGTVSRVPGLLLDILRIFLVLVASAFIASEIWAVDLGSLLAALGVGSVVLGLALQDTLSGLFAGVSLLSGRQFKEGDWIEFGDASGKIVKMDWRSVTVETLDDERLMVIPNSELSSGTFTILSSSIRSFGQNLNVCFSYGSPPARVMAAIETAILSVDLILRDPPHDIDLMETADTGIVYEVTIHTATREEGEEAATWFFRRLWYISQREGLSFAGAVNRKYAPGRAGAQAISGPEIEKALAATAIFLPAAKGFSELASSARVALYDDGEKLIGRGDAFSTLFLIMEGRVSVTRGGIAAPRSLQHVQHGEFFVSRAFLTGAPSVVELVADGETLAIGLGFQQVMEFLNLNPQLARLFESAIDASDSGLVLVQDKRKQS